MIFLYSKATPLGALPSCPITDVMVPRGTVVVGCAVIHRAGRAGRTMHEINTVVVGGCGSQDMHQEEEMHVLPPSPGKIGF